MKLTIYFSDTYITASDPKSVFLLISMLTYSDGQMMQIIDDDGHEVWFSLDKYPFN